MSLSKLDNYYHRPSHFQRPSLGFKKIEFHVLCLFAATKSMKGTSIELKGISIELGKTGNYLVVAKRMLETKHSFHGLPSTQKKQNKHEEDYIEPVI